MVDNRNGNEYELGIKNGTLNAKEIQKIKLEGKPIGLRGKNKGFFCQKKTYFCSFFEYTIQVIQIPAQRLPELRILMDQMVS